MDNLKSDLMQSILPLVRDHIRQWISEGLVKDMVEGWELIFGRAYERIEEAAPLAVDMGEVMCDALRVTEAELKIQKIYRRALPGVN